MQKNASFRLATFISALILIDAMPVCAAVLPGSVLPDQVAKSLTAQQPVAATPAPQQSLQPAAPQQSAASEQAKKIKFTLKAIKLKGNHVYTTETLSHFYNKLINKEIPVSDLFEVVQNITNFYRNNGYILTRAILPPQHVKTGTVEIEIIEGYIDKVEVTGTPHGAKCIVKAMGSNVTKCPPLRLEDMEYALTVANELPSTQVQAVLSPSTKNPGAADLILKTTNTPITGYFSYDNYGTRYIGPQQLTANLAVNSAITSGDSTQLTFTKTPKGGEMSFMDLNYSGALTSKGSRLTVGATRAHTHPLFVLQQSQIDGLNNNYYSTATIPILRERARTMNLTFGFNYMDSETTSFSTQLYADHVRSLDIGTTFNNADRWYGSNSLAANFRQGLPIWGYTKDTNPDTATTSRPGGRADYTKITGSASRLQAIKGPVSIYGQVKGQWAFNPLLSSEQFSFGGNPLGRGYDAAELIGDRGAAASLELRYDLGLGRVLQSLQLYTFYDAGMIWNLKTATGTPFKLSGTSMGFGSRFYFTNYISGNLMWTQTLTKPVAAEELINQGRRPRTWFSIVAAFM